MQHHRYDEDLNTGRSKFKEKEHEFEKCSQNLSQFYLSLENRMWGLITWKTDHRGGNTD